MALSGHSGGTRSIFTLTKPMSMADLGFEPDRKGSEMSSQTLSRRGFLTGTVGLVAGAALLRMPGAMAATKGKKGTTAAAATLPTFDVRNYGAKGDGVTDDTAAIIRAVRAAEAAGGGVVFFGAGVFLVNQFTNGGKGFSWAIPIKGDNITIRGSGANSIVRSTATPVGALIVFWPHGAGRTFANIGDFNTSWVTAYPVIGMQPAAKGATSITLANNHGLVTGDTIFIRTGQTIPSGNLLQPDAEINTVTGVSGNRIFLQYPLAKPYAQEYYSPQAPYRSSATTMGLPAPFGVSRMTDNVMRNLVFEDIAFDTPKALYWMAPMQAIGVRVSRVSGNFGNSAVGCQYVRSQLVEDITATKMGNDVANAAVAGGATGTTDLTVRRVTCDGHVPAMIHLHEGVAQAHISNVTLRSDGLDVNTDGGISIRGRSYDTIIENCFVSGATRNTCLTVDADCMDGGIVRGNRLVPIISPFAADIRGSGWQIYNNSTSRPMFFRGNNSVHDNTIDP